MNKNTVPRGVMGFPSTPVADPEEAWRRTGEADTTPTLRTLYIHYPFCRSRCAFCPFYYGGGDRETREEYGKLLVRELRDAAPDAGRHPVNAVYFGGGTPSDMDSAGLARILETLHDCYRLAADCEITVEGRIDGYDDEKLHVLSGNGVNRLSIGVQTFDTARRRALGRHSDRATILRELDRIVGHNQMAVVIDLIFGLPGQTLAEWEDDVTTVLEKTRISGLDLYRLRTGGHLPLAERIEKGELPPVPGEELLLKMHMLGAEMMRDCGAVRLSGVHYALNCRERNVNNDVSGMKSVCLPFGMKAGGRRGMFRFSQTADFGRYRELVTAGRKPLESAGGLPPDFPACAELAGELYRRLAISPERIATAAGTRGNSVKLLLESKLRDLHSDGMLEAPRRGWSRLTEYGIYSTRKIATALMEEMALLWEEA